MGVELALLGAAASASAGTAATAGLIGSAGTLFGVSGLTASALGTGFSLFSGLSSILGGRAAADQGAYQSELALQQAGDRAAEQERLSIKEAQTEQDQADDVARRQKLAYLSSGVSLQGSPLLMMEETRAKGRENVDEILRAGQAASDASKTEGRVLASQAQSSGRKAFANGLTNGLGTIASALG